MSTSSTTVPPILPQGVGYAICVGFGAFFAITMWYIARVLSRLKNEIQNSEMFMTAKRSINTGLISSAVVSSWTVSATLLTSTTWAYDYGVSGAYYWAGACVQILLFSVAAIELKRKAPGAHTFLELTKIRYGVAGHWIQIFYSTLVQIFNSVNFLVGGSAVFASITGMNPIAGCFLLPIGVVLYTITGGIKATFLVDYMHTVVIYVLILIALFSAYATSPLIGSPDAMYELLVSAAQTAPVAGNPSGSYLTFHSLQSLMLGIVIFTTAWAAVADVQLFQKAIAANPADTLSGYLIGGLCWFAIPFSLATTFGLVGRALSTSEVWPTFPRPMSAEEVNKGLVLPYAAQALLGKGGAIAILLMMFMAVTSAFSSELVCVASVLTYDVYRAYINPKASDSKLLKISHASVVIFAICCACIATGLSGTAIGVNFIVTTFGIICAPAVFPIACTLLWRKQNTLAVVAAPLLGTATGIACWIGSAHRWYDQITIGTLEEPLPLVVGNATALLSPLVYSPAITYLFGPQDFKWEKFKDDIKAVDEDVASSIDDLSAQPDSATEGENVLTDADDARLKKATMTATFASIAVTLGFIVVLPMPLYGTRYIFSKPFFRFWIVFTFAWAFIAALVITLLPLWQGRETMLAIAKELVGIHSQSTPTRSPAPVSSMEEERPSEEKDGKERVDVFTVATA